MAYGADVEPAPADPYPVLINHGVLNTLKGVNYDDARVAIEMNFDRQKNKSVSPRFEPTLEILPDVATAARRIQDKKLHCIFTTGVDFIRLRELVTLEPLYVTSGLSDSPLEPYILLAQKDVDWAGLVRMDQRRLIVDANNRWDIGRIWLETVLYEKELPQSDLLFTSIQVVDRPARMVLPVFFGQAEACLVSQSAYDTMVELNPQLGQKLHILMRSPGFVKSLICIVSYLDPDFVAQMKDNIHNMHKTVDGRQLLMIFQLRRSFPFKPEYLVETERVLRRYRNMMSSSAQNRKWNR